MIPNNGDSANTYIENRECLTIGRIAPDFTAITTQGVISLSQYRGNWVVLFSHPGDFTPVCTSEFISFAQLYPEFEKRNVQLIGLSIDSNPSHIAWLYDIFQFTGLYMPFPLIADRDAIVSNLYGMVNPDRIYEQSVRDVFIIDPLQRIRAILSYPATVGRNMYELIRLIDALQISTEYEVSTPANWMPGEPVIQPLPQTYDKAIERAEDPESFGVECPRWYYCFEDLDNTNQLQENL